MGWPVRFWAVRDWLLGKSEGEERAERRTASARRRPAPAHCCPLACGDLLWVLAVNGGLLGLEGIVQRLEGSGKLLFLVKPRVNPGADTQFGPYAYRANASQYFNLLWPVCLGFWWTLNRSLGFQTQRASSDPGLLRHHGGLPDHFHQPRRRARHGRNCGPGRLLPPATHFLLAAHRQPDRRTRTITLACLLLFFTGALALGFGLGWKTLKPRMAQLGEGFDTPRANV